MENPVVLFEVHQRVGVVTLNHPEKRKRLGGEGRRAASSYAA